MAEEDESRAAPTALDIFLVALPSPDRLG